MENTQNSGYSFFAIGIAFFVIGLSTQWAFFPIGVAFFVIGIAQINKSKEESEKESEKE